MNTPTARLKAAEALIDRLRDQLQAAHDTIGRLEAELAQVGRAITQSTALDTDDLCGRCGKEWRRCRCDYPAGWLVWG